MNLVLWIIAAGLAAAFGVAGLLKLVQPKPKLSAAGMGWVDDFSGNMVKTIGALEVLAAIGLLVPALVDTATVFIPLAALGLVLLMIGAAVTHVRRREPPMVLVNAVLGVLAAVVVWQGFSAYGF